MVNIGTVLDSPVLHIVMIGVVSFTVVRGTVHDVIYASTHGTNVEPDICG